MGNAGVKGVMFDMDNTLLRSRIDFAAMKRSIFRALVERRVLAADLPLDNHTSSTLIALALEKGIPGELHRELLAVAARYELDGMRDAGPEPGAIELLSALQSRGIALVVVTNNSQAAAEEALLRTGMDEFVEEVIGRERMASLKPSPSGYREAQRRCGRIPRERWLSVGDSWIDGIASQDAGIPFVGYGIAKEELAARGVRPIGTIRYLRELLRYI